MTHISDFDAPRNGVYGAHLMSRFAVLFVIMDKTAKPRVTKTKAPPASP